MTSVDADAGFTLKALQDMLGISRADVVGFIEAGFVSPGRGPRNAYRFGFQDVVLLRTAQSLRSASIPASRIRKALQRLKAQLPAEMPLSGLRITAQGDDIAVREQGQTVAADSGQILLDFDVAVSAGPVLSFAAHRSADVARGIPDADETADRSGDFLAQGATRFDQGDYEAALGIYEEGLVVEPTDADLLFNRGVVLEELGRGDEAVRSYEKCLDAAPATADAHWNLARLFEERGVKTLALRHFSAYRRLSR